MDLAKFDNTSFPRGRARWLEALWLLVQWLLVSSAIPGSRHRRFLLRVFGAKIGSGVCIKPRVRIKFPWRLTVGDNSWIGEGVWIDNLEEVSIGANCCLSQEVYICTGNHDWTKPEFNLVAKPVRIGNECWICARGVLAPGVTAERGSVLALGSVATTDLRQWTIYQGVPAHPLRARPELMSEGM